MFFYKQDGGIWPSGQSSGLIRRRSRFDPRQGRPLYIWMYTPSAVSILGMDMCAIQKFLFHLTCGKKFLSLLAICKE
jgi:hypothetical protein